MFGYKAETKDEWSPLANGSKEKEAPPTHEPKETRVKIRGGDIEIDISEHGVSTESLMKVALDAFETLYAHAPRGGQNGQYL